MHITQCSFQINKKIHVNNQQPITNILCINFNHYQHRSRTILYFFNDKNKNVSITKSLVIIHIKYSLMQFLSSNFFCHNCEQLKNRIILIIINIMPCL